MDVFSFMELIIRSSIIYFMFLNLTQPVVSLHAECGYKKPSTKGLIFESKAMNATMSFYATNSSTIYGCHHACQYNCRCTSTAYYATNISVTNNCLLFDVINITEYLTHNAFANVTFVNNKQGLMECPDDCLAALKSSLRYEDGIYRLVLRSNTQPVRAVCDMETDGGGWTLLQRRFDGSVNFYRDWSAYKNGFGDLNGEFWLGLDTAHELMKGEKSTLRFDLWAGEALAFAEYYNATISSEADNYTLNFNGYKGNAGDSMFIHNNMMFSTKDVDNDVNSERNCAEDYLGAWWYAACHYVNLNGNYGNSRYGVGLNWYSWKGHHHSLSKTEIKIKIGG